MMMRPFLVSLALGGLVFGVALSALAQQQGAQQQQAQQPAPVPSGGGGAFGAQARGGSPFPNHPGREIVAVACTQCHGPNVFTQLRMGDKAWRAQIYDMILRGAQIGPNDIDAAVKYMVASYGPGVPFPNQPPAKQVALAGGQGKEVVEGTCALCHGIDRAVDTKRSNAQWKTIVARMVFLGAPLSANQESTVVDYLSKNYGVQQTAAK